ncbi:MAG: sugar ABC transporter substrate-binding protein [Frankia sp.]
MLAAGSVLAALTLSVAACTSSNSSSGSSGSAGSSGTSATSSASGSIGLLLPETKTTRYEAADKPYFEAKFKALCPNCKILYSNADQNAATQQSQAEQAMTNGAKVLVLDPVDGKAAAVIARDAASKGVKVVSYDRLISGAKIDAYISFDNEKVGQLQGQALVDKLGSKAKTGQVIMINGSADDNNALLFKKGALSVLTGKVNIGYQTFTPDWAPDTAGTEMDQAITKVGKNNIAAAYSANDGMAAAIVASLKRAGVNPLPPVTGQDAQVDAVQRILVGQQFMSVYKAIKPEAEQAAQLAFALLQGKTVTDIATSTTDNGAGQIPSVLLTPVELTKSNIQSTVIKDGFLTVSDICTSAYKSACTAAGIH